MNTSKDRVPVAVVTTTIPLSLLAFGDELVRQLTTAGYRVTAVSSPGPNLADVGNRHGIRTVGIPMAREITPVQDVVAARAWWRLLRRERPELILAGTPKAAMLALPAARAAGVPHRAYLLWGLRLEGELPGSLRRRLLTAAERLTGAAATDIVANSPSLLRAAQRARLYPAKRLRTTDPGSSHGVDAAWFTPRAADPELAQRIRLREDLPVLGLVGRLTSDKGIDTLLGASQRLTNQAVPHQLLVVGPQDEPDSLAYVERLRGGSAPACLVGAQDDVRPFYALMDVHVLPSRREGFPNVVLESAAMEIPTVTTNATGCVDSVIDHVTGRIVPVDDPIALASALSSLLADPSARLAMGRAARERAVRDFAPDRVVADVLRPYLRLTGADR